jgi:hypothetical protein
MENQKEDRVYKRSQLTCPSRWSMAPMNSRLAAAQDCRGGDEVVNNEEGDLGELEGGELDATHRLQRSRGSPPDLGRRGSCRPPPVRRRCGLPPGVGPPRIPPSPASAPTPTGEPPRFCLFLVCRQGFRPWRRARDGAERRGMGWRRRRWDIFRSRFSSGAYIPHVNKPNDFSQQM